MVSFFLVMAAEGSFSKGMEWKINNFTLWEKNKSFKPGIFQRILQELWSLVDLVEIGVSEVTNGHDIGHQLKRSSVPMESQRWENSKCDPG